VDCHLGRVGAGDEIGRAEQIEEMLVVQPLATMNDLIAHHGNVRRRPAKSGRTELEKEARYFAER
jgi:hypothetical protein